MRRRPCKRRSSLYSALTSGDKGAEFDPGVDRDAAWFMNMFIQCYTKWVRGPSARYINRGIKSASLHNQMTSLLLEYVYN